MENEYLDDIYEMEIAQREFILNKVRQNIKISKEERLWLVTHSVYNRKLGKNALNIVIEKVPSKKWLSISIKVESVSYDKRIIPIIGVPGGKGKIVSIHEVTDLKGNTFQNKPVKVLGLLHDDSIPEHKINYYSDLGLISVEYECDYFDDKSNLYKRESSSTGNTYFAMKRQVVDEYTIRYYCKSPMHDSYDALVFSVHWESRNQSGDGSLTES